jgi:hypothetical protein
VSAEVFKAAYLRLAREAATELGADVPLPGVPDPETLIDALAVFLWEHRHLARGQEDGETDSEKGEGNGSSEESRTGPAAP